MSSASCTDQVNGDAGEDGEDGGEEGDDGEDGERANELNEPLTDSIIPLALRTNDGGNPSPDPDPDPDPGPFPMALELIPRASSNFTPLVSIRRFTFSITSPCSFSLYGHKVKLKAKHEISI